MNVNLLITTACRSINNSKLMHLLDLLKIDEEIEFGQETNSVEKIQTRYYRWTSNSYREFRMIPHSGWTIRLELLTWKCVFFCWQNTTCSFRISTDSAACSGETSATLIHSETYNNELFQFLNVSKIFDFGLSIWVSWTKTISDRLVVR